MGRDCAAGGGNRSALSRIACSRQADSRVCLPYGVIRGTDGARLDFRGRRRDSARPHVVGDRPVVGSRLDPQRDRAVSLLDDRLVRARDLRDRSAVRHADPRSLCRRATGAADRSRLGFAKHWIAVAGDGCVCREHGFDSARGSPVLLLSVSESFRTRAGRIGDGDAHRFDRRIVRLALSARNCSWTERSQPTRTLA